MSRIFFIAMAVTALMVVSCQVTTQGESALEEENTRAEKMLQGIWIDEDDGEVTMKVSGNKIQYADPEMSPVKFAIIEDSLVLKGYQETRYLITKQTDNVFQFQNMNGDIVRLARSTDPYDEYVFRNRPGAGPLNQGVLIKRDTVVFSGSQKYHVYVQVNPCTTKVFAPSYNDDGVQVENVYYDNIVNVCIYNGASRLYSSDVHKQDLRKCVPEDFIGQAILSDIVFDRVTDESLELTAMVCRPNTAVYYAVRMVVSKAGKAVFMAE